MGEQALKRDWRILGAILAPTIATVLLAGCLYAPSMRLLKLEVYRNDELILRTMFDAPYREGPDDFWRRAEEKPFASDEQVDRVKPTDRNPFRARITGVVRVQIRHANDIKTSASLTGLTLVRDTNESNLWYLSEDEVERARQAAGA